MFKKIVAANLLSTLISTGVMQFLMRRSKVLDYGWKKLAKAIVDEMDERARAHQANHEPITGEKIHSVT